MPTSSRQKSKSAVSPATAASEIAAPAADVAAKPLVPTKAKASAQDAAPAAKKSKSGKGRAARPTKAAKPRSKAASGEPTADKVKKEKLVRDSFTMPKTEYAAIAEVKSRALALGRQVRKSEVIRAGLASLTLLSQDALSRLLASIPTIKTGRPKHK